MTSNSQHSNALKLIVLGTPNLPKGSALRPRATLPEEAARQKVFSLSAKLVDIP